MPPLLSALKNWIAEKNALGLIVILSKSKDPLDTLRVNQTIIDKQAIQKLLHHSRYIADTESTVKGLEWEEIARQASVIGGDATDYADCLDLRASLLQKLSEQKSRGEHSEDTSSATRLLDEAWSCAEEALAVYKKANAEDCLPVALGRLSVLADARGNKLDALRYRLPSLVGWTKLHDVDAVMPRLIDDLVRLFWSLRGQNRRLAAETLARDIAALEIAAKYVDDTKRGDLFDVLGSSYGELDQPDEAVSWWNRAIESYRSNNSRTEEFITRWHLQKHAYRQGQPEKVIEYGLAAIGYAPDEIEPWLLAQSFHLVGFAYKMTDQAALAILAYHRAFELYVQAEDTTECVAECLLEAGLLERSIGDVQNAKRDLERVGEYPSGGYAYWIAEVSLAELLWRSLGNLGGAIRHADRAVQWSIGWQLSFVERAKSHFLSAILHLSLGNNEKALARSEALLRILDEDPDEGLIHFGEYGMHQVALPSKADAVLMALTAAAKAGREAEQQYYLQLYRTVVVQAGVEPDAESKQLFEEDEETSALLSAVRTLSRAEHLLWDDPNKAATLLEETIPSLEAFAQVLIVAQRDLGIARMLLHQFELARACFNHNLKLLEKSPDVFEEITCRLNLGEIEGVSGNMPAAYSQFSALIQLKEAQRASLSNQEARASFLENIEGVYLIFLGICLDLGLLRETLETIEKLKSRVLLDLVGQASRRPVDYQSLSKIRDLENRREAWDSSLLLETNASRSRLIDQLMETDSEKAREYIYTPIRIQDEIVARQKDLEGRNFLLALESQSPCLSFSEIRELCDFT
jgi:tetratricopeptide (TPR) repeat protein